MVLARASLGLPCNLSIGRNGQPDAWLSHLQTLVQGMLGLQNDILGWEQDVHMGNRLNAIQVLIRDGMSASTAFHSVLRFHNELVRVLAVQRFRLGCSTSRCCTFNKTTVQTRPAWDIYVDMIVGFGNAMVNWMLSSGRYQLQTKSPSK